jgi:hypothetical protein
MKTLATLTITTALLFTAACGASVTRTDINAPPRPMAARHPATVEVFTSGAPMRPHVDVAVLEAEESSSFSQASTGDMIVALRRKAGAMGCDGVVVSGATSRDPGLNDKESWLVDGQPRGRKGLFATCIVYSGAPPMMTAR